MKAEELFEKLGYKKQVGFESICYVCQLPANELAGL